MKRGGAWAWRALVLLLGAAPMAAQALDLDYYTYNAFEETVAAFQRVSLVLADPGFLVFATIFAVLGVLIGGIATASQGLQGQQVNPIAFFIPAAIGVALFQGLVIPTGTLYVYDPVRNANQAVGDVPDVIVLLAGGLNKLERGIVEIVDTASAELYAEDAGATEFSLVLNAWSAGGTNVNLERSLRAYFTDCGMPAMAIGHNGASMEELTRNTPDLMTTFARWNSPGLSTVYYPGPTDAAVTGTCADAWSYMSPLLGAPATLANVLGTACAQAGFDRGSVVQMARCEQEFTAATRLYGITAASSLPFIRSVVMARAVSDALSSDDFKFQQRQLVDRQIMAEGFGAAEAMNRWVPKLRGYLIATVLGLLPITLLFVVTPFMKRAVMLAAGLFTWVTLWGITDAISVQMARDSAIEAFEQLSQFGLSYNALMSTPEAAIQALGVFGKSRTMALMLATVLSYGLFHFGGYAFTSIAQSWQQHLDQAGESAGRTALLPEGRGAMMQQLAGSVGTQAAIADSGFISTAYGAAQSTMRSSQEARYIGERVQGGLQPGGMEVPRTAPESIVMSGGRGAPNRRDAERVSPSMGGRENPNAQAGVDQGEDGLAEVRVQASVPDRLTAPRAPYGLVDLEAREAAGKRWGHGQSAASVASRRSGDVFDTGEALSAYGTTMEMEAAFGRREQHQQMPGGPAGAGRFEGLQAGARTRAFFEIYRNINRDDEEVTADGMFKMARQLEGAAIAVSRAGGPEDYIRSLEQSQILAMAYGHELERTGTADLLGLARAEQEIVRSVGFLEALSKVGNFAPFIQGAAFSELLAAGRGVASYEHGAPWSTARDLEESGLAAQIARNEVSRRVADFLDLDETSMKGLIESETLRAGAHLSLAVPASRATHILKRLDEDGVFSEDQRRFMAGQGGFSLSFDLAENGALSATATAGGRAFFSETFDADYGRRLTGDLATLPHLDRELLRAYEGNFADSTVNEPWFWRVAGALGDSLSARGIHLRAASDESLTWSSGMSGQGQVGTPAPGVVGSSASGTGHGGFTRSDGDSGSTSLDLNTAAAARILQEERGRLIVDYERVHGQGSAVTAVQEDLAYDYAAAVEKRMDSLYELSVKETRDAAQRNDVYEDAFKPIKPTVKGTGAPH